MTSVRDLPAWLRTTARRPAVPILVTAAALGVVIWALTSTGDSGTTAATSSARAGDGVVLVQAMERVSTESLTDWVNVADHVVAVTVTGEERIEPGDSETSPDGEGLVDRVVRLRVNDVLWSSPDATRTAPDSATVPAGAGWMRHEDGTEQKAAQQGSSRLEVGGEYTLGLVWKPAQCGADIRIPARWAIIGSGSILPADDGTIGLGEFEGVENTSKQDAVGPAVAEQFQGEGLADLADALTETEPTEEVEFLLEQELCSSR